MARCCVGGEAHGHHPLETIRLVVGMVRRLEDEDLAVPTLERGDAQARGRIAEQPVAERIGHQSGKGVVIVELRDQVPATSGPGSERAQATAAAGEHLSAAPDIEIE
jgi:hypothetical protein